MKLNREVSQKNASETEDEKTKRKRSLGRDFFSFVFLFVSDVGGVESLGELSLLVGSVVLVQESAGSSLIDLLHGKAIERLSFFLVAGSEGGAVLADRGAELALEDLVLQGLRRDDLYTLLCALNVRHRTMRFLSVGFLK